MNYDLDATVLARRSVRGFLRDRPVPRKTLDEAFVLAQHAPSNCNVQPWRVFVASGERCDRLRDALGAAVRSGAPPSDETPPDAFAGEYRRLQVDCAVALYSQMGVARDDRVGRAEAMARNFDFFDAPHVAIICMDRGFGLRVALDVGMYVQTLLLALWARGVANCAQASLASYPEIIRRELDIPADLRILCGVSLGYEDPAAPANRTRQVREPVAGNVVFVGE